MDPSQMFSAKEEANIRSLLNFSVPAPRHLILFKNKSEEESFMRLAHRIYSLHMQTKDEVIYTYQRVFKYLMESLTKQEFETLSFFSVNRLIDSIFKTKVQHVVTQPRTTLTQFLKGALELNYIQSAASKAVLHPDENIKLFFTKPLWHSCRDIDVGKDYSSNYKRLPVSKRQDQQLQNQLTDYIQSAKQVKEAPEKELPSIMRRHFYQSSEYIARPMLSRLVAKRQQ